jgi:hypothetical protein
MKIRIKNIVGTLIGISIVIFALSDILQSQGIAAIASLLSMLVFILTFPQNGKLFGSSMFFIGILLFFSLINILFTNNGIGGSLILIGNLLLSYIYLFNEKNKLTTWIIIGYLFTLSFISIRLFLFKLPANEIYTDLSRNHAGFALTFWTIFVLFHIYITYNKVIILFPLISLVMSIPLIGRTSIVVNLFLFLLAFLYKLKRDKKPLAFVSIIFICLISYFLLDNYGQTLILETNLAQGVDTPRWKLWEEYFSNINLISFITGVDVSSVQLIHFYGDNPHNSFLKFHSRVGFGAFIFFLLFLISIFVYLKNKSYYIAGLLLLLSVRALFDSDIFIGNFDFIFYIITFYWIVFFSNKSNKHDTIHFNHHSII